MLAVHLLAGKDLYLFPDVAVEIHLGVPWVGADHHCIVHPLKVSILCLILFLQLLPPPFRDNIFIFEVLVVLLYLFVLQMLCLHVHLQIFKEPLSVFHGFEILLRAQVRLDKVFVRLLSLVRSQVHALQIFNHHA